MSDLAIPEAAPVTLFRTDDPQEMIARATDTANALAAVVRANYADALVCKPDAEARRWEEE